jgi:transcription factor C subunit 7
MSKEGHSPHGTKIVMRNTRRQHFTNPTPIDLLPPIQFSEPSSITFASKMPVTQILLLRHGDRQPWSLNPATGEYSSREPFPTGLPADPPLAPGGVSQSEETAKHLSSYLKEHADQGRLRIYSSLFYRCLETLRPSVVALRDTVGDSSIGLNNLQVRGETGIGEWFGRAWFIQPRPGDAAQLRKFFPWVDENYKPKSTPADKGEKIHELHDRVAKALALVTEDVDNEFAAAGKGDQEVTLLFCSHAAAIIASGRALTGNVPTDYDEIDFKCFTSGISRFVRKKVPAAGEAYFNDDWRNSGGVAGGWDCELNSDTSHLSGGPQNGWHFQGDQAFDSYEAASKMGVTELSGSRDP